MGDEPTQEIPVTAGAPDSVPALSVGGIRRGVCLIIVSILQTGIVAAWVASHFGFNTKLISIDDIQAVLTVVGLAVSAITGAYVGIRNIWKRYQVGKDPQNPAPPIQTPAVVQAVKRLSNGG